MTTRPKCIRSTHWRTAVTLALVTLNGCVGGIDETLVSPISNDETVAMLGYLWSGARTAIQSKREPDVGTFNLALSYQLPCTRGGRGSYQGTLAGSKSASGGGSGTLSLTAVLAECQFDERQTITTITASGLTANGTIAIVGDFYGPISIRMVAATVTLNGKSCPGGVDVMLTGTSPSSPPISTGTACGRTGAVPLP